jgi:hypothetical protein
MHRGGAESADKRQEKDLCELYVAAGNLRFLSFEVDTTYATLSLALGMPVTITRSPSRVISRSHGPSKKIIVRGCS